MLWLKTMDGPLKQKAAPHCFMLFSKWLAAHVSLCLEDSFCELVNKL